MCSQQRNILSSIMCKLYKWLRLNALLCSLGSLGLLITKITMTDSDCQTHLQNYHCPFTGAVTHSSTSPTNWDKQHSDRCWMYSLCGPIHSAEFQITYHTDCTAYKQPVNPFTDLIRLTTQQQEIHIPYSMTFSFTWPPLITEKCLLYHLETITTPNAVIIIEGGISSKYWSWR